MTATRSAIGVPGNACAALPGVTGSACTRWVVRLAPDP